MIWETATQMRKSTISLPCTYKTSGCISSEVWTEHCRSHIKGYQQTAHNASTVEPYPDQKV